MKHACLFTCLLALLAGAAAGLPLGNAPRHWDRDGNPYPASPRPASKDPLDSVLADVHAYSCYITTVRALDCDPAAGAASLIFRSTDGLLYALTGMDNGGTYTRQGPLVTGSVRYPSSMCDLVNQRPYAFFNRGWGEPGEGAYVAWDDMGYGGGLWSTPVPIDSFGAGTVGAALYGVNGVKGSNGRIHACANYWGDFTPDAAFYYQSDDGGYTWSQRFLIFYDLHGTEDSLELFGGGPVVHDSMVPGYINQVQVFCSPTGDTVMLGSCCLYPSVPDSVMKFWYRISYDGGDNWTPITYVHPGQLGWPGTSYDLGIALDKEGYPHFITWLFMDTTAAGGYGPNTGLVDYHQTASGWVSTLIHATDEAGTVFPSFANAGLDPDGNIVISYRDNLEGDAAMNIWLGWTLDNGSSYNNYQVTYDNGGYDYPHIAMHAELSAWPIIYYQRVNTGFIWWFIDAVSGDPAGDKHRDIVMLQSRPNPARDAAELSFGLAEAGDYRLSLYNISGQLVTSLAGRGAAGRNSARLDLRGLASGTYLCRLEAEGRRAARRMVILK